MKTKPLYFACLLTLSGFILLGCGSSGGFFEASAQSEPASNARIKAPQFSLLDLNGKNLSLENLKGKVVFIDFWATWCPPCIWSSPQVEELTQKFSDKKFVVLSISMDADEGTVREFFQGRNPKTRVAVVGNSGVENQYRISGIPAFFLIDQEGYLVRRWGGFHENLPATWKKEIERLLNK